MKKSVIGTMAKRIGFFLLAFLFTARLMSFLPYNTFESQAAKITEADIQALRDKIKATSEKSKSAQNQIEQISDEIEEYLKIKELLDQQILNIQNNIEDTGVLIQKYEILIAEREERIALREAEIAVRYENFRERLRLSYEDGTQNYLELLISSKNLVDFMTRADHLGSVLSYEQALLEELDREVSDLNDMKSALELKKNEYIELGTFQEQSEEQLVQKMKEADDYLAKLEKNEKSLEAVLKKLNKQKVEEEKELEQTIKKFQEQQRAEASQKLLWPLAETYLRISSKYGSRVLYGKTEFHLGIDIPAPYGTDIYASNPGTVLKARYSNSYGYYILIDHGGVTSTLYAHCSKLLVDANDTVKRGQVIAKVGATGNATGYHLHYEVRKSGVTTNPLVKGMLVVLHNGKYVDPVSEGLIKY